MDRLIPSTYGYNAPVQITKQDLLNLEKRLQEIVMLFKENYINKKIEEALLEGNELSKKDIQEKFKTQLLNNESDLYFVSLNIQTKKGSDNISKSYKSIKDAIIDTNIKNENVIGIHIITRYGTNKLSISFVRSDYDHNIKYSFTIDDNNIFEQSLFIIREWIKSLKPKEFLAKLISIKFPLIFSLILILLIGFVVSNSIQKGNNDNYFEEKAITLIEKGINEENFYEAVDLILKMQIEYSSQKVKYDYSKYYTFSSFIILIFLLIFLIPQTTIGLGKNESKAEFNKKLNRFILFSAPSFLLVYIIQEVLSRVLNFW